MVSIKLTGEWDKAMRAMAKAPAELSAALSESTRAEASLLRRKMVAKLKNVQPPQAPSTALTGGKGKPLQRTGNLRGSIGVVGVTGGYFVGVPASSGGFKLADIHEHGRTIVQRMTEKQRRFLHALFKDKRSGDRGSGSGILVIRIPARPFIGPAIAEEAPKIPKRFRRRVLARFRALTAGVRARGG